MRDGVSEKVWNAKLIRKNMKLYFWKDWMLVFVQKEMQLIGIALYMYVLQWEEPH